MLDPLSCFPHPKGFHYNAKGYLELAKILESNIIFNEELKLDPHP